MNVQRDNATTLQVVSMPITGRFLVLLSCIDLESRNE